MTARAFTPMVDKMARAKREGQHPAAPRRESMALNRMRTPQRKRQAIFLGKTGPRAARPGGHPPRVHEVGAVGRAAVNGKGVVSQFDCGGTSRTNSFAPQPLPNSRAISSNFIAGYASALLVFALHTGLAHERRIFPIAVEKAQGDREYRHGQYRMHLPPFATIKLRHDWKRATTEAIASALGDSRQG